MQNDSVPRQVSVPSGDKRLALPVFMLLCCLFAGGVIAGWFLKSMYDTPRWRSLLNPSATIMEQVVQVAKLVTVEMNLERVENVVEPSDFPFPWLWKDKKAMIVAHGRVMAGFDLKKDDLSVGVTGSNVTVRVPEPSVIAQEVQIEYYDVQGSVSAEAHNWLLTKAKMNLRRAAIAKGILEQARTSLAQYVGARFPDRRVEVVLPVSHAEPAAGR